MAALTVSFHLKHTMDAQLALLTSDAKLCLPEEETPLLSVRQVQWMNVSLTYEVIWFGMHDSSIEMNCDTHTCMYTENVPQ